MFEQAFKNIDDVLWKEAGCTTELDYTEQTSWLLFLKYLDGLEQDRALEAELEGKRYTFILEEPYRWESWAAPKGKDGKLDHNRAQTGDDLRDFVNLKLFPYLHGFKQKATGPNTIEYKIGEIFGEIKNKISSGYNLREIIDHIDELRFRSQTEKHELSHLYEAKIRNMGNAGRNGGEYYTPRPLIRAIVEVVQPRIGERIYDGACGSAGFLCESFDFMKAKTGLTTKDLDTLQARTFYGKEKKSLAYVIAIMNMILHGIEAPNIVHTNTLTENLADIQDKDRFDVVLANPPFGGKERKEVQQNFPIRTGETAFLFLQHFIKILKAGGRGGVVIKNTFLSNTDNASVSLRKLLLESCNLHTVLDCPGGTFQGAGVKTVVLFFEKGAPTRKVWFYQLEPGRSLGKTNPLNDEDLREFVALQKTFADSPKSWSVDAAEIDSKTLDLSVKNPNGGEEVTHRSPEQIISEIAALDAESVKVLQTINTLQAGISQKSKEWVKKRLGDVCTLQRGYDLPTRLRVAGKFPLVTSSGITDSHNEFKVKGPGVVTGRSGSIGNVFYIEEDFWPLNTALYVKDFHGNDPKFVYRLLTQFDLERFATGAGVPTLNRNFVHDEIVVIPQSPTEQRAIVSKLDSLEKETQRLESIYRQKLAALDELKKSLLHKAFNGELS
ncbi:MAG TPA: N-6 DNA methylase [Pyrinomonadaceae bacterium]|nr:N-6 DNA methylase [Pyrinomonadaceae bacterium]